MPGPVGKHIDDGLLKARRDIRALRVSSSSATYATPSAPPPSSGPRNSGRTLAAASSDAEMDSSMGRPPVGDPFQGRSARPVETQQLGDLIESLADRIVHRAAQPDIVPDPGHRDALRMSPGQQEQQIRKRRSPLHQARQAGPSARAPPGGSRQRRAIPLAIAMPLPNWHPTINPPISPGPDVAATPPRSENATPAFAIVRRTCSGRYRRCDLAAISGTTPPNGAVLRKLAQHGFGQNPPVAIDHRRGRLIARRLDPQNRFHRTFQADVLAQAHGNLSLSRWRCAEK